jgi:hypothetical protein
LRTALRRIANLGAKNVAEHAQKIAFEALAVPATTIRASSDDATVMAEEMGRRSMVSHILNPLVPNGGLDDPGYLESFRRCDAALRLAGEALRANAVRAGTMPVEYRAVHDIWKIVDPFASKDIDYTVRTEEVVRMVADLKAEVDRLRSSPVNQPAPKHDPNCAAYVGGKCDCGVWLEPASPTSG